MPKQAAIRWAGVAGADRVELYTEPFAVPSSAAREAAAPFAT